MVELHKLKVSDLKAMIRYYNIHVIVRGYSKLNKTELINLLNQYMDNGPSEITSRPVNIPYPRRVEKIQKSKKSEVKPVEEIKEIIEEPKPQPKTQPKPQPPEVPFRRMTRSQTK